MTVPRVTTSVLQLYVVYASQKSVWLFLKVTYFVKEALLRNFIFACWKFIWWNVVINGIHVLEINKIWHTDIWFKALMGLFGVKSSLMISHMNVAFTSHFSISVSFPSGFDVMNAPKLLCDCLISQSVCLYVLVIKFMLGVMTRFLSSNCITGHVVVDEYTYSMEQSPS